MDKLESHQDLLSLPDISQAVTEQLLDEILALQILGCFYKPSDITNGHLINLNPIWKLPYISQTVTERVSAQLVNRRVHPWPVS
jgi:hypothetical protein